MTTISERQYTLAATARMADLTPATLRNWCDREFMLLSMDAGKWRRFCAFDVLKVALSGRLSEMGIPVKNACYLGGAIPQHAARSIADYADPASVLKGMVEAFGAAKTIVYRDGERWTTILDDNIGNIELPACYIVIDSVAVAKTVCARMIAAD